MHNSSASIRKVQSRGQVTIPERIRERCGIEPGTDLLFVPTGPDEFVCHRVRKGGLLEFIDSISVPGVAPDMDELREGMGDDIWAELTEQMERSRAEAMGKEPMTKIEPDSG